MYRIETIVIRIKNICVRMRSCSLFLFNVSVQVARQPSTNGSRIFPKRFIRMRAKKSRANKCFEELSARFAAGDSSGL